MYKDRIAKGYTHDEIMASIYAKGRDNARTPMQWTEAANGGFTTGTPWIQVNPNYTTINAQNQVEDPKSIFQHYKKLIKLRKENAVIVYGDFQMLLPEDSNIFAYVRTLETSKILVLCNFYGEEVNYQLPKEFSNISEVLIANYEDTMANTLRPYEAIMCRLS